MTVAQLTAVLELDASKFNAGMNSAENRLQNFGNQQKPKTIDLDTAKAISKLDDLKKRLSGLKGGFSIGGGGLDGLARSANQSYSALSRVRDTLLAFGVGMVVIGGVAKAFDGLKYSVIDFNSLMEKSRIGFTTMMNGNAADAARFLDQLKQFSIETPFEFKDLVPLTQRIRAFGFETKELIPIMRAVGDQVAAIGGDNQSIDRITLALGQIRGHGKLMGQELRQLQEAGVRAREYIGEALNVPLPKVGEYMKKGMIGGDDAVKAITSRMERDSGGMMQKLTKTLSGAMSNLKDVANITLSDAFRSSYDSLSEFVNKLSTVAQNKDFQRWATEVAGTVQSAMAFCRGAIRAFVDDTKKQGTVAALIAKTMGNAFIWLGTVAVTRAMFTAATSITMFAATTLGQFVLIGLAIAAFGAAYETNFMGIQKVTDFVVGGINYSLSKFSIAIAKTIETVSGFLQKVPDAVLAITPGAGPAAILMKKLFGDQAGLADGVKQYWDEIAAVSKNGQLGLQTNWAKGFENLSGIKLPSAPNFDEWMKKANGAAGKAKAGAPYFFDPQEPSDAGDKAAKKKSTAKLKLEKDQLTDSARFYDLMAKAAEDSAKRQIAALTGVRDTMRELFGGMQSALLKEGVTSNPLGPMIEKFQNKLNIEAKMKNITTATASTTEYLTGKANAARSQVETKSGLDGYVPTRAGSGASNLKQTASQATNAMMLAMGKSFSSGEPYLSCAFVASRLANAVGANVKTTASAGGLRANAIKAGWMRADPNNIQRGDLIFNRRNGGSGWHVKTGANDGMVVNSSHRKETMYRYRPKAGDEVYRAPSLSQRGVLPKNPSYVPRNNAATLRQMNGKGSGSIVEQIDGTLSKIAAVPKAWGGAIRDTETSTNRFQVQTALANKEFQDFLRAILGANFDAYIMQLRVAANKSDILLNRVRALHTSFKAIKDIDRAEALRGQENDPIAALRYDFAHERKDTPNGQQQWEIYRTRNQLIGDMTAETEKFIVAQQEQAQVLAAGLPFLKADTESLAMYARAIDLANLRLGIQNELRDRLNSKDSGVKAAAEKEVDKRFAGAEKTYDAAQAREKEVTATAKLNDTFQQMIRLRDENTLAARESSAEAIESLQGQKAALEAARGPLVYESKLRSNPANTDAGIEKALQVRAAYLERLNELTKQGIPLQIAMAGALLWAGQVNINATLKERLGILAESTAAIKASVAAARGQLSSAQESLEGKRLQSAGKLSELAKQDLAWKHEDLQRVDKKNAATAEELAIREQIRDVLRETARVNVQGTLQGLDDQIKALGMIPGRSRDNYLRDQEIDKNPEMTDAEKAAQKSKEAQITALQETEKRWQDSAARMQGLFRSAIDAGFSEGAEAGIKSFLTQISTQILDRGKDALAAKLTNGLFGRGAVDGPEAFQVSGKRSYIPESATGLPSKESTPTDTAIDAIKGVLGIGGGSANAMNANVININSRLTNINGGISSGTQPSSSQSSSQLLGTFASVILGKK